MKKSTSFINIVLSIILLTACSNQNLIPVKEAKDIVDTYGITAFSVIIDTKEQSEALSASFSEKKERSEAEYLHKKDEVQLHGKKALTKISGILEEMDIDPETDETTLIKKTADAFEFSDFKTIKIDITFKGHDGKKISMSK
ncbi:YusW family protein [Sporosarcina oncorhynchi]|uniref:YusW family protein n=1 Tax=Sporosarcina oncorhynchi TaxID=3056444 RepID=A0ABZ0L134_9BACL|nr:YusW family protein [Sporosarcina sp. T2O-4]WOV86319.1 YusW family protein [Sporosarcina sp. T2O-4]